MTALIDRGFFHDLECDAPDDAANSICYVYLLQGSASRRLLPLRGLMSGDSSGHLTPPPIQNLRTLKIFYFSEHEKTMTQLSGLPNMNSPFLINLMAVAMATFYW